MPVLTDSPARSGTRTRLVALLFVIYLALLTWIVLWKLALPWIGEAALLPHPLKLIPFLPDANDGPSAPIEVIGNLLLFVPFGIYLGLLAPSWQWWKAAGVFLGASLIFEIVEPLLSIGSFDTTDLIVNTAGGLAGLGLMALARRMLGTRSEVAAHSGLHDRNRARADRRRTLRRLAASLCASA